MGGGGGGGGGGSKGEKIEAFTRERSNGNLFSPLNRKKTRESGQLGVNTTPQNDIQMQGDLGEKESLVFQKAKKYIISRLVYGKKPFQL